MEVDIPDNKLRKAATDMKSAIKQYGPDMARKLHIRMASLKAADSLGVFWPPKSGPERCHELQGRDAAKFTVDLAHPYRLVFIPIEDEPPTDRSNEQEHWSKITKIQLLSIEDTHD